MTRAGSARLWWASLAAAGVLGVVLVAATGTALTVLAGSRGGDPHGYALIFSVLAMVFVAPPTVLVVAGVVGLLRRRRYGYTCTGAAYGLVAVVAVLLLGLNASSPGSDGMAAWEVVVPILLAVLGVTVPVVAALGAREAAR